MQPSPDQEIQELEARFEARKDRDGRGFVPLADAHRRAGSLERALELVEEGLERYPDLIAGQLVGGRVFRARGDLGRARAAYGRVLELHGEHPEALGALAEISERQEREAEAREFYHRWALAEPEADRPRQELRRLKRRHFREAPSTERDDAPGPRQEAAPPEPAEEPAPPEPPDEEPSLAEPEDEPSLPEPGPPEGAGEDAPPVYTRTMGELYARQGLTERAVEVYRKLVERDPDDPELRERLDELEAAGPTAAVPPGAEPEPGQGAPAAETETDTDEPGEEQEVEDLAREWAAGPDETGSLDSPFAWGEEEEPAAAEAPEREAPVLTAAAYFERLLQDAAEEHAGPDDDAGPDAAEGNEPGGDESDADEGDLDEDGDDDFRRWLDRLGP